MRKALYDEAMTLVRRSGSISEAAILKEVKRRFPVAHEIEPQLHLRMQAAFQEHVDAAVSKTVNLPADASPQAVREIFLTAHQLRLKGVDRLSLRIASRTDAQRVGA